MSQLDVLTAPVTDLAERSVLGDWRWLVGDDAEPLLLTAMGDMFIRRPSSGEISFLDALEGSVESVATSYEDWKERLCDDENLQRWFLPDLVDELRQRGMVLAPGQCYSPIHPPVLGGDLIPDNIEVTSWRVHFYIAGQIHGQTRDLPLGTKIGRILIDGKYPIGKPWWKFGKA
jgi:hypothetical protein